MSSDRWTDIRPVSPATDPFRAYPEGAGTWSRRVMAVEDEPLLAALLSEFLTGAGFEVRTCASAADVADCVEDFDPDAALIDINPGRGPSGVQVGQLLHRTSPHIGLVFLTKYADPRMTTGQGVPAGSAFLHKGAITDASVLIEAVETVLRDGLPPLRHDIELKGSLAQLTATQLEILRMAALGWTNAAIARSRATNERAVEKRLQAVFTSLAVPSSPDINPRVEAVRRYIAEAGFPDEAPA
jgi:DNA-binding NarL/FixJ family response regulator